MARKVTRDELEMMLEEIDRGEAPRDQLEKMIEAIELSVPDEEALELMEDPELSSAELADQLTGYTDLDA